MSNAENGEEKMIQRKVYLSFGVYFCFAIQKQTAFYGEIINSADGLRSKWIIAVLFSIEMKSTYNLNKNNNESNKKKTLE